MSENDLFCAELQRDIKNNRKIFDKLKKLKDNAIRKGDDKEAEKISTSMKGSIARLNFARDYYRKYCK